MKEVTMYETEDGQRFPTAREAELHEHENELRRLVRKYGPTSMDEDEVADMILDSLPEFQDVLSKIVKFRNTKP
jgi:hypothetical protein